VRIDQDLDFMRISGERVEGSFGAGQRLTAGDEARGLVCVGFD
jgi:hypothetical protein